MVLVQTPTGLNPYVIAGGGGGAGCFDETPGIWNGVVVSYAGSSSGVGNSQSALSFPQGLLGGQVFSGGSGAALGTRLTNAGRATSQLQESEANQYGNGIGIDLSADNFLNRTGGLSIQGGGGGGGGYIGGGAGCAIVTNPKSSTGGGGGLS